MTDESTQWLIQRIGAGDQSAWQRLIDRFEGRLTAFVRARMRDAHVVEDVVQETFLGFLRSLPHFDPERDLQGYLFTIAAHKIRDHLRREGRRPVQLMGDMQRGDEAPNEPPAGVRGASSLFASHERMQREEVKLAAALEQMIEEWKNAGDYCRIKCIELLFVTGWSNRDVANYLDLTEQQVANYKFQVIERLGRLTKRAPTP
jgi:RNA polymerase sigma-70 factor, ECF subfamily